MNLDERVRYVHTADGVRLAITELGKGSGPAVVLVHGFAQNRNTFLLGDLPAGLLSAGARVFVAELRGHGRSERPAGDWDVRTHLDLDLPCVVDTVAQLTGGPIHYQGHSMGGMLGYLALGRRLPIVSLVTYCAPMIVGATRLAVRAAAVFGGPASRGLRSIPMDTFLRAVSGPLSRPSRNPGMRAFQRFTSLVNPELGVPEHLRSILAGAEPEAPGVARQLAAMAVHRRPELLGVDLGRAVCESPLPVCVVVGTHDVFAPPRSVAPFFVRQQAGRRRLIQIPGGSHVDVPAGHHAFRLGIDVWRFVTSPSS